MGIRDKLKIESRRARRLHNESIECFAKESNRLTQLVQYGEQEKFGDHYWFPEEIEKTAPSPGTPCHGSYIDTASDQIGVAEQVFTEWLLV